MGKQVSTVVEYDAIIARCRALMLAKNGDYGDSWREMRPTSITDQILVKAKRIKNIEDMELRGEKPQVSEGKEVELRDIINYAVFELIQLEGEKW